MMSASSDLDPPALSVRDANGDDSPVLTGLLGRDFVVPELDDRPIDPCDRAWVAELAEGGDPIGLVGLRMIQDHSAQIHDLWVSPKHRGQGVGVQLVGTCLGYCRDHGIVKTLLHAEDNQTAAIQLFQKVGFMLARSRQMPTGDRLEFYMDLYRDDADDLGTRP